jgi:transposase
MDTREPYPSDVSDKEWELVAPYLTLLPLHAEQRRHDLREVLNAMGGLVRSGACYRMTCRLGRRSISKCSAGSRQPALRDGS